MVNPGLNLDVEILNWGSMTSSPLFLSYSWGTLETLAHVD